jgi:flagellar protein FliJ
MKAHQRARLRRIKEFEVNQSRLRASQIETMIAEFDRICLDLARQIEAEEMRTRIDDPENFAYPTLAKAARERCAKLERSIGALRIELETLRDALSIEANEPSHQQFAFAASVAA